MIYILSFKKLENLTFKAIEKYMSFTVQESKKKEIKPGLPLVFMYSVHF